MEVSFNVLFDFLTQRSKQKFVKFIISSSQLNLKSFVSSDNCLTSSRKVRIKYPDRRCQNVLVNLKVSGIFASRMVTLWNAGSQDKAFW